MSVIENMAFPFRAYREYYEPLYRTNGEDLASSAEGQRIAAAEA
jgi:hypothetical protein